MRRNYTKQLLFVFLIVAIGSFTIAQDVGYRPGIGHTNPRPHLGSTGGGPPLSTALPSSGAFSRGLVMGGGGGGRSVASTGRPMGSGGGGGIGTGVPGVLGNPSIRNQQNAQSIAAQQVGISGRSFANGYMNRALYRGIW